MTWFRERVLDFDNDADSDADSDDVPPLVFDRAPELLRLFADDDVPPLVLNFDPEPSDLHAANLATGDARPVTGRL